MTNEDTPDDIYALIAAARARLVTVDLEIGNERIGRQAANDAIKELLVERHRLERIVRASQPRTKKTTA